MVNIKPTVEIYTDGACSGNPGKGGYGAVLRYKKNNGEYVQKELSQGYECTTNNRMELLAVIVALESLKCSCDIVLTSDSKYVLDTLTKGWLESWKKKNWKNSSNKPVKNIDLWKRLDVLINSHSIKYEWVKGHNGHEFNEICDKLAVEAYNSEDLICDEGFVE